MYHHNILKTYISISLFLLPTFTNTNTIAQEKFPVENLRFPVLINVPLRFPAGGFYLSDSSNVYLVTARHVLFNDSSFSLWSNSATLSSPSDDVYQGELMVFDINLKQLLDKGYIKYHKMHDVAIVTVGGIRADQKVVGFKTGIKRISHQDPSSDILGSELSQIRKYKNVFIGNDVYIVGYPSALGIKSSPQFDYTRPLLRKGVVAGKYDARRTIIVDCPTYIGNSGSPVFHIVETFEEKRYEIVGIVSQFIPFDEVWVNKKLGAPNLFYSNSGYSIVEPIDAILELISK